MRSSDIIDVISIARGHVGGILFMNKNGVKCRNRKWWIQRGKAMGAAAPPIGLSIFSVCRLFQCKTRIIRMCVCDKLRQRWYTFSSVPFFQNFWIRNWFPCQGNRRQCSSTGFVPHTTVCKYACAAATQYTSNMAAFSDVYRMTTLSPRVYSHSVPL